MIIDLFVLTATHYSNTVHLLIDAHLISQLFGSSSMNKIMQLQVSQELQLMFPSNIKFGGGVGVGVVRQVKRQWLTD